MKDGPTHVILSMSRRHSTLLSNSHFYLYNVEVSNCPRVIHKQVGDTVELPSCLPTEGVTTATWKYGDKTVVDMEQSLNTQSTVMITLYVHGKNPPVNVVTLSLLSQITCHTLSLPIASLEPITTPVLTANTTSHAFNGSCTVFLRCISDGKVNYNWTMRARTHRGSSTQHYTIRPQDGETTFTCTIWNVVSERSASTTVTCSNDTSDQQKPGNSYQKQGSRISFIDIIHYRGAQ
uniref:Ig-like domain-containing protein n=1 Tax=Seriola dumerili TaxID=41447 RepID=A0A3B4VR58_SERDU